MKKTFKLALILLIVALVCGQAVAGPYGGKTGVNYMPARPSTGYIGDSSYPWLYGYFDNLVVTSATITTLTGSGSMERNMPLPVTSFLFEDTGAPLSTSTTPGLEFDDYIPSVVYADGELSKIMITFRVPANYSSGGAFRVLATESAASTPTRIDFDAYVNKNGVTADTSTTNQTPVSLSGVAGPTSQVVTLTPATDFASLVAGDWVTLRIWRDDTATGTADLEIKGVDFYYTTIY